MTEPTTPSYGQRLRALRKDRGMTQRQLQAASGVAQALISRYERGVVMPEEANARALDLGLGQAVAEYAPAVIEPPRPGRGRDATLSEAEIVRRYQLLRRFEDGRLRPGEELPERRMFRIWRGSGWLAAATRAGILPPGPELGGEYGVEEGPPPSPAELEAQSA
jgi:transcriptional regulator with XRE-family HTH domain